MASSMKQFASNFKVQFQQDQRVIESIQLSQEANLEKTRVEREKLDKLNSTVVSSFC